MRKFALIAIALTAVAQPAFAQHIPDPRQGAQQMQQLMHDIQEQQQRMIPPLPASPPRPHFWSGTINGQQFNAIEQQF